MSLPILQGRPINLVNLVTILFIVLRTNLIYFVPSSLPQNNSEYFSFIKRLFNKQIIKISKKGQEARRQICGDKERDKERGKEK